MRVRYSNRKFGSDRSIMKGTLLRQQISYLSVFQLLLDEILWMCVLVNLHTCAITLYGWLWSVNYEGHFTWKTKYIFVCTFAFTKGNSLDYYTYQFLLMCYHSIMKGTVLGERRMFPSVSQLLLVEVPWIIILFYFICMHYKHRKFGSDRPIMNGTLLGEQSTLSSPSQILLE
jgi:hypothetical protein